MATMVAHARTNNDDHPVHSVEDDSNNAMEYKAEEDTAEEESHGGDSSGDEGESNADDPAFAHSIDDGPALRRRIIEDA